MKNESLPKVLIVTGGLLNADEKSVWNALKKQFKQIRAAKSHWLETKIKLVAAELILNSKLTRKSGKVAEYFNEAVTSIPELTEVVLADLLQREDIHFEVMKYDLLFSDPAGARTLLKECPVVFASSTLLHDLSELLPLIKMLKTPDNKIVLGGALCGSLQKTWGGDPMIDIVAVGYGEFLVPVLAEWIRSGYSSIEAPEHGRIEKKQHSIFLFSGVPDTKNLDFLPTPDWRVAEKYHGTKFSHIYYESVRGCPYRCSFCNYPFLFDDKKFRMKSADKIASDWKFYHEVLGVQHITCLDSLFTMPKNRLIDLCEQLIRNNSKMTWTCYARADDLADEDIVILMKKAGAYQVQIGIESGNQMMLDQMNKRCTVEQNMQAIRNCRKHGISTLISLIVGYPGESEQTLNDTLEFMREARPDFHFLATFSVRIEEVPMFNVYNRERFGLEKMDNPYSFAPYWRHNTMSCITVGNHVRALGLALCKEKISLDGALFYQNILKYEPSMREEFLDYQKKLSDKNFILQPILNRLHQWVDSKMTQDMANVFPPTPLKLQTAGLQ